MTETELINKVFEGEIKKEADALLAKYETKRASILEVLRLLMEKKGHITLEMEEAVGVYLDIPPIDVREVMTFYTLFYSKPRAKTRFNVCRTLACSLTGGDQIIQYIEEKLQLKAGAMTPDAKYSLEAVECLGACEIAPMMQLNDYEFLGFLTKEKIDEIIAKTS